MAAYKLIAMHSPWAHASLCWLCLSIGPLAAKAIQVLPVIGTGLDCTYDGQIDVVCFRALPSMVIKSMATINTLIVTFNYDDLAAPALEKNFRKHGL